MDTPSSISSRQPLKLRQPNISKFFIRNMAEKDKDSDKSIKLGDSNSNSSTPGNEDNKLKVKMPFKSSSKKRPRSDEESGDNESELEEDHQAKSPTKRVKVDKAESDDDEVEIIEVEASDSSDPNSVSKKEANEDEETDKTDEEEYEVEKILDYSWCNATNQGLYKVKWLGWEDENDLTWEPKENLDGALQKLKDFYFKRLEEREAAKPGKKRFLEVPPDPRTHFERRSEIADSIFPPPCLSTLEAFFMANKNRSLKAWPDSLLNSTLDQLNKSKAPNEGKKEKVKHQLMIRYLRETRKNQLERLREWEREINQIEDQPIVVENNADLEGPPRHMQYITQYKPSAGIVIPDDPLIGCECTNGCTLSASNCCPDTNDASFPYNKFGKLRLEVGMPIFECNKRCSCDPEKCFNRVVQKGRKVKLCIYRTDNGCGWGVKALEKIKKGTFVVEYVGEVITNEQAEERGKVYDAEGRTYLFDLDYNLGHDNPYTVDAANYGNVSHFINHCCDPNLSIFNVWINCLDPNLPRLCMFARKDIAKGEQITFDYCRQTINSFDVRDYVEGSPELDKDGNIDMDKLDRSMEVSGNQNLDDEDKERKRTECKCGAANCRKWLFDM